MIQNVVEEITFGWNHICHGTTARPIDEEGPHGRR